MKYEIYKIAMVMGMVALLAGIATSRDSDAHVFKFMPPHDEREVKVMEYPIMDTAVEVVTAEPLKVVEKKPATKEEQLKQLEALLVQLRALLAQLQSL